MFATICEKVPEYVQISTYHCTQQEAKLSLG